MLTIYFCHGKHIVKTTIQQKESQHQDYISQASVKGFVGLRLSVMDTI
jgi:hypothetical protein